MPQGQPNSAARSGEAVSTSLQVSPLVGSARIARFVAFLHRDVGAPEVDFEPHQGQEYSFQLPLPADRIIEALLDSVDFRPQSLRSFAAGRLHVRLADVQPGSAAEIQRAPAPSETPQPESRPDAAPLARDAETNRQQTAPGAGISDQGANHSSAPPIEAAPEKAAPEPAAPIVSEERRLFDALTRLSHVLGSSAAEESLSRSTTDEPAAADAELASSVPTASAGVEESREPSAEAPVFLRGDERAVEDAPEEDARRSVPESETSAPERPVPAPDGAPATGVQLIARPFSNFGQLNRFITAIGGLTDVRSVTLRRFRDGTLWLAVDCADATAFGARLRAQHEIPVEVLTEADGTIEVTVREEPRQAASA